jgi:uncharacterized protein
MTRLLFWIGLVILIVMAVRSKLRAVLNANDMAGRGAPAAGPSAAGHPAGAPGRVEDATERMACCAACGLHFPASEAVTAGGREYCSTAHAHAHSHPAP